MLGRGGYGEVCKADLGTVVQDINDEQREVLLHEWLSEKHGTAVPQQVAVKFMTNKADFEAELEVLRTLRL